MQTTKKASLILDDGTVFHGKSFGYEKPVAGEVVFNTAMIGYPENLTDPSYTGQILVSTYPLIGNYGVPPHEIDEGLSRFYESEKIHVEALVVLDYSYEYSHWNANRSLADWLKEEQIPAIYDIDTRALTKHLREHGSMKGKIVFDGGEDIEFVDPNLTNLVAQASCQEVVEYGRGDKTVVVVDCGVKHNSLRWLINRGVKVVRVPWDYDFNTLEYDGLFLSDGPGDPDMCDVTIEHIRQAMEKDKPILGICLGNQLLAKAAGARTYKLRYGHRGHNQPVRRVGTQRCFITTQNHGYAVEAESLGADWETTFVNMNDGSVEGIRHKSKPFFAVQFHPEAANGPSDTETLFDEFVTLL